MPLSADMDSRNTHHRRKAGAGCVVRGACCVLRMSIAALLFLRAFSAVDVPAQTVEGSNFKVGDLFDPPYERQMKSLIEGARWRHQGSQTAVYDAKVQRFRTNGALELIIEAPECFYDENHKAVNSAGPVQFRTADGRFSLSGVGFLWLQTNSILYISNRVQTIVFPELTETGSIVASTNSPAQTNKGVTVFSDRFQYIKDSGVGIYSGNVRAVGTNVNFKGKSEVMEVLVPVGEHQLQTITMTDKVALDYENIEASGQKAVYTAATGLAKITGSPAWHDDNQRQGRGDELVIDRTNKLFRANGQAWAKMPTQSMGANGFLSSATNSTTGTNQFVDIFSDFYEFRTNSAGNSVLFGDHVCMVDSTNGITNGTLTAATMLVTLLGTNELQSMVAQKNVVIENDENQFTGEKAVYTATNGILELTGNPAWRAGPRKGNGDLILADLKRREMEVRTNAWMRVPASQLGPSTAMKKGSNAQARKPAVAFQSSLSRPKGEDSEIKWPQMEPDPPTVRKEGTRTNSPSTPNTRPSTNEFADIYSETYTVTTNTARFEGGVRIIHPRLNWVCQTMNVDSPNPNTKDVTMTAEQAVEFNLKAGTDENQLQDVHGICNHAVYNYAITPSGANDTMTLTGNPILETTNGIFKNKILILDCANNKLMAPGRYKIYGTNATTTPIPTNVFRFPSGSKKK
jgi:lipopolysaccharide export system protein LptA